MDKVKLEIDLLNKFITLNDLRLENKVNREQYVEEFNNIMNIANCFGIELFTETNYFQGAN